MVNRLVVSSPYRENAVVAIARSAANAARLNRFFTTLYLAGWQNTARSMPLFGARIGRELSRRAFSGIPASGVASVATLPELLHVGARRLLGSRNPALSAQLMYWVKARFDAAVARRVQRSRPQVLVGMYAASLESFKAVHRHGGMTVLNFVNSHPAEHNRYLMQLAGLRAPHHELIPDWVSRRVEEELELADLVLVPSRFVTEQLIAHGVPAEKLATLPYGVDLSAFLSRKQDAQEKERLECLYVGQISYRKGIPVLLDAARRCRDLPVHFRLIGPIVSADVLVGLPDNVAYEGPSFPGGVADLMRQADIFVLPTVEDACALVVLEAMSTALPVVTTTNNGSGELIEDGQDGLIVPSGDAAALADAIRRLAEQPELRALLGDAAHAKVQSTHSWESYGESVLDAIESRLGVLKGHCDSAPGKPQ
jgi:glycosyltransferase involved in cell wall biosynthesis